MRNKVIGIIATLVTFCALFGCKQVICPECDSTKFVLECNACADAFNRNATFTDEKGFTLDNPCSQTSQDLWTSYKESVCTTDSVCSKECVKFCGSSNYDDQSYDCVGCLVVMGKENPLYGQCVDDTLASYQPKSN
jgi:hypothetical protein